MRIPHQILGPYSSKGAVFMKLKEKEIVVNTVNKNNIITFLLCKNLMIKITPF